ncbi:PD-(D/E)XK nuclease family protein [Mangrovivirga sp. M17]|uniref:PD-(D/E)XK nuclease family protein n=1 Tax=Mangrovivirga halotolerans TaxID=2993936 RepID=A0ABT3RKU9_9BACT|nr:PD-(D/E)XK nuclease family protein [Mangrovivirga halotolerans]MCX2742439.1 PD-(D/E)XK nuclease family protein [Mangrovivirga halotolerans]
MITFLESTARELIDLTNNDFRDVTIVFPGKRAGIFFQRALGKLNDKPIIAPQIYSIEEFFNSFTNRSVISPLQALIYLHKSWVNKIGEESFDDFFYWGELLLKDFEDIDKYLVPVNDLFKSVEYQKEVESGLNYLDEEQVKILRKFWKSFEGRDEAYLEKFRELWEKLPSVYMDFKNKVRDKDLSTIGLIQREVGEKVINGEFTSDLDNVYFVGFNALTTAEEKLISWFRSNKKCKLFWDTDAFLLNDKKQEGGRFHREYFDSQILGQDFPKDLPNEILDPAKKIIVTELPGSHSQLTQMSVDIGNTLFEKGYQRENTAVILPDESLLFPALYQLPDSVDKINVTMGVGVNQSDIYGLYEDVISLYRENSPGSEGYFYRAILSIIGHALWKHSEEATEFSKQILNEGKLYYQINEIPENIPYLRSVLELKNEPKALNDLFIEISNAWIQNKNIEDHEKEMAFRMRNALTILEPEFEKSLKSINITVYSRLLRKLVKSEKASFEGEPVEGLQIMGMLETRGLDFEAIFIPSMNEEIFPSAPNLHSFIPYNLRRAFNMPTFEHLHAIYAYYFYRLLKKAKEVYLYANKSTIGSIPAEISRFIRQMDLETDLNIDFRQIDLASDVYPSREGELNKSSGIQEMLYRFTEESGSDEKYALSPSAIKEYLVNPELFYTRYVLKVQDENLKKEDIAPNIHGLLFHRVAELIYEDFTGKDVTAEIIDNILNDQEFIEKTLDQAFEEQFTGIKDYKGEHLIFRNAIRDHLRKLLTNDKDYAPFTIIGLEENVRTTVPVEVKGTTYHVRIKGNIDRIDLKDGVYRILDYKTGKDQPDFESIDALFDKDKEGKFGAALQVLIYGWLFSRSNNVDQEMLRAGVIKVNELFKNEDPLIKMGKGRGKSVFSFLAPDMDYFEDQIVKLISEMLNPDIPFHEPTVER